MPWKALMLYRTGDRTGVTEMLNPTTTSTMKRAARIPRLACVANATSGFTTKASLFVAVIQTRAMRATTTTSICTLAANTAAAIEKKSQSQ